jgi:N-acetylmuramoyl-L-alanine amidase CwlA
MEIKENITTRNYTKGNNRSIKFIVIHYVGAVSSAKNNSDYFKSAYRGASAHYFVDDNDIYRVVRDGDTAWHCGTNGAYYNGCRNSNSIGIEMCCFNNNGTLDISENIINRTIELTKELMAKYNIPAENVVRHYDVTHKCCPAPFVNNPNRWNDFKSKLGVIGDTRTPVQETKSIVDLANEVIAGKYGVGDARRKALGSLYDEVQAKVNELLGAKPKAENKPSLKSVDEIAREVINGAWGNGQHRFTRLSNAGYDANAVQNRVNELLGAKSVSNKKSNETIADEVIAGKWGNGSDRKNKLTAAGYDYNAIQAIVNRKLK